MRSVLTRLVLILLLTGSGTASAEDGIEIAMSRDQVLRAFGSPPSRMENGDTAVFIYPHLRVTLKNNLVSDFRWLVPPEKRRAPAPRQSLKPTTIPERKATAPASLPPVKAPASNVQMAAHEPQRPAVARTESDPPKRRDEGGHMMFIATGAIALLVLGIGLMAKRHLNRSRRPEMWESMFVGSPRPEPSGPDDLAAAIRRATVKANTEANLPDQLTPELLRELEWKRFEELVCEYYKTTGAKAELTSIGADGGVDVKLYHPGDPCPYAYVQCKSWFGRETGVKLIRELFGVMTADQVREGIFVTTSDFSDDARTFAAGKPIKLIDGTELIRLFTQLPERARKDVLRYVTRGDYTTPTCPSCDVKMVLKIGSSGNFWRCRRYPRCRQTLNVRRSR